MSYTISMTVNIKKEKKEKKEKKKKVRKRSVKTKYINSSLP